jgi:hypothetical protein
LVHAGIAASDVICCARLGKHAQVEDHNDAVRLLDSADRAMGKHLKVLLGLKTRSGYTDTPTSRDELKRSERVAEALMEAAVAPTLRPETETSLDDISIIATHQRSDHGVWV